MRAASPEINLYMEYNGRSCLEKVLKYCREHNMKLLDMEITRNGEGEKTTSCIILTLRLSHRSTPEDIHMFLEQLHKIKGVDLAEEI